MSEWGSVEGYEDDQGINGQPKMVVLSMGVRNRMDVLPPPGYQRSL